LPDSLTYLACSENDLTSLPALPSSLFDLDCSENKLTSINLSGASLTWVDCSNNKLTFIDLTDISLTVFDCSYNILASESAVTGRNFEFGGIFYTFSPQNTVPTITTQTLPNATVNTYYNQQIEYTGNPEPDISIIGELPTGLSLGTSGLISGTPTVAGTSTFTVKAENNGGSDTQELSITVEGAQDNTPNNNNSGSSNNNGSVTLDNPNPSGSPNSGKKVETVTANSTQTQQAIQQAVQQAAQVQAQTGSTAIVDVKLQNAGEISAETAQSILAQVGGTSAVLTAQSLSPNGKSVDVQIKVDLSKVSGNVNLSASSTSQEARKTDKVFEKHFANTTQTLHCEQKGTFGQSVSMAAKVSEGMPTDNLTFYSYNADTNTFIPIQTQYWVDTNGYVHFNTELANDIIISDGPLTKKA
jgi:hypothetical protein